MRAQHRARAHRLGPRPVPALIGHMISRTQGCNRSRVGLRLEVERLLCFRARAHAFNDEPGQARAFQCLV